MLGRIQKFVSIALLFTPLASWALISTPPSPAQLPNWSSTEFDNSDKVDASPGSFTVNNLGAATYTVPILTPPGTAGATPRVSLRYNSQAGNGFVGKGWSISGVSRISRCRQTTLDDGQAKPITFSNEDRFCLDGMRMVRVSGGAYGSSNTTYRLRIDDGTIIETGGSGGANGYQEPDYFLVKRKDGSVTQYGNKEGGPLPGDQYSQTPEWAGDAEVRGRAANGAKDIFRRTLHWNIKEYKDSANNIIGYKYINSDISRPLDRIHYGFGGAAWDPNSTDYSVIIDFVWEDNRDDTIVYNVGGLQFKIKRRLKNIEVETSNDHNPMAVRRKYYLKYTEPGVTHPESQLKEIKECYQSESFCKEPTTFSWKINDGLDDNEAFNVWGVERDINLDNGYFNNGTFQGNEVVQAQADINGDGYNDLVWQKCYTPTGQHHGTSYVCYIESMLGSSIGLSSSLPQFQITMPDRSDGEKPEKWTLVDLNADGKSDIVYRDGNGDLKWRPGDDLGFGAELSLNLNNTTPYGLLQTADINGDGLTDIFYETGPEGDSNIKVRLGTRVEFVTGYWTNVFYWLSADFEQNMTYTYPNPDPTLPDFLISPLSADFESQAIYDFRVEYGYHGDISVVAHHEELIEGVPMGDFNGDGKLDIVTFFQRGINGGICFALIIDGDPNTNCPPYEKFLRILTLDESLDFEQIALIPIGTGDTEVRATPDDFRIADINGDGISDLLARDISQSYNVNWTLYMGSGTGFNVNFVQTPISPLSRYLMQLADMNDDGYADLVTVLPYGGAQYLRWRPFDPATQSFEVDEVELQPSTGSPWNDDQVGYVGTEDQYFLMDTNGDNNLDLVKIGRKGTSGFHVWSFIGDGGDNVVFKFDNGLGNDTTVEYGRLNDPYLYGEGTWSTNSISMLPHSWLWFSYGQKWNEPIFTLTNSQLIVEKVERRAPSGNQSNSNVGQVDLNSKAITEYLYEGFRVQPGRGVLGFESITELDLAANMGTHTLYRQDYPFVGVPWAESIYTLTPSKTQDDIVQTRTLWHKLQEVPSEIDENVLYPVFTSNDVVETYDLDSGDALRSVMMRFYMDEELNHTQIKVETRDGAFWGGGADVVQNVITNNVYAPSGFSSSEAKELGLVSLSHVHYELLDGGVTISNEYELTEYDYYSSSNLKGKLESVKTYMPPSSWATTPPDYSPDVPPVPPIASSLILTTDYDYDQMGNPTKVTQTGHADANQSQSQDRYTRFCYDSKGRFVDITYKQTGASSSLYPAPPTCGGTNTGQAGEILVSEVLDRDFLGNITEVQDAFGRVKEYKYGKFGRLNYQYDDIGSWQEVKYQSTGISDCPSGGQTWVSQIREINGERSVRTCYDRIGRVIRTARESFSGSWAFVDTEYDTASRVLRHTEPYFENDGLPDSTNWNHLDRDGIGRITKRYTPGSHLWSIDYNNYRTDYTDPNGNLKFEVVNPLGQLSVVQEGPETVNYYYDAFGNVDRVAKTGAIEINMVYDDLGRKIEMTDPDKGGENNKKWTYKYNDFGELVEQKDPKNQKTVLEYDRAGRMVSRESFWASGEQAHETTWGYDSNWFGALPLRLAWIFSYSYEDTPQNLVVADESHHYGYDTLGRLISDTLEVNDIDLNLFNTYDEHGRPFQKFDPVIHGGGSLTAQHPGIEYRYNARGFLHQVLDASYTNANDRKVYYEIQQKDASERIKATLKGEQIFGETSYDELGRVSRQYVRSGIYNEDTYLSTDLVWDAVGNLASRDRDMYSITQPNQEQLETFCYDNLNRLVKTYEGTLTGDCSNLGTQDIDYDSKGNIVVKEGWLYTYNQTTTGNAGPLAAQKAGPHAMTMRAGYGETYRYDYDLNGNMIKDGSGRDLAYSAFDKVQTITQGQVEVSFNYGADHQRIRRVDINGTEQKTTTYVGNVELIDTASGRQAKRYLPGGTLITHDINTVTDTATSTHEAYLIKDHLGSVASIVEIVNGNANRLHVLSYDAWGHRRDIESTMDQIYGEIVGLDETLRGFTSHEMVDSVGIIHMNGRIYDPAAGRFLQADPFVDGVASTQGFNRYSYVKNRQLSATDPSGYDTSQESDPGWGRRQPDPPFNGTSQPNGTINGHSYMQPAGTGGGRVLDFETAYKYDENGKRIWNSNIYTPTQANGERLQASVNPGGRSVFETGQSVNLNLTYNVNAEMSPGEYSPAELHSDFSVPADSSFDKIDLKHIDGPDITWDGQYVRAQYDLALARGRFENAVASFEGALAADWNAALQGHANLENATLIAVGAPLLAMGGAAVAGEIGVFSVVGAMAMDAGIRNHRGMSVSASSTLTSGALSLGFGAAGSYLSRISGGSAGAEWAWFWRGEAAGFATGSIVTGTAF